jgi:hypothetical protein
MTNILEEVRVSLSTKVFPASEKLLDRVNAPRKTKKIKERIKGSVKTHICDVSLSEMPHDQQALFEKAVDALLADLIQNLDRRLEGNADELERKSMAGQTRNHCCAPK